MKVAILAGGLEPRLLEKTEVPKPLVGIGGQPVTRHHEYDLAIRQLSSLGNPSEKWSFALVDTGLEPMTGGRVRPITPFVAGETFCLTYGDGLAEIAINNVVTVHWGDPEREIGPGLLSQEVVHPCARRPTVRSSS